ncbi:MULTISPECIES: hypothetical protein [Serratia]|uniref:hypothetical protein n=1 Tax=Serratia TaxID=613 RepID=UPI001179DFF4|nr:MULTISPECIES: hypothetical protein [Serratia]MBN5281202.1 hypothetical protein [Serratia ureilytica]MBN5371362.1 hypothetical protein [Serratia ureilytica]
MMENEGAAGALRATGANTISQATLSFSEETEADRQKHFRRLTKTVKGKQGVIRDGNAACTSIQES